MRRVMSALVVIWAMVAAAVPAAAQQEDGVEARCHPWLRQFGTTGDEYGEDVAVGDGGVVVVGRTEGALTWKPNAGGYDVFVRRYGTGGKPVWTRQFGTSGTDTAFGVELGDDGIYLVGSTTGGLNGRTNLGSADAFVRKYALDGTHQWTRQFGSGAYDVAFDVVVHDGTVFVVGATAGALPGRTSAGGFDAFLRAYTTDGAHRFTRQFGTSATDDAYGVDADGTGVYVAGRTEGAFPNRTSAGFSDVFLRRYGTDGSLGWTRQFGTVGEDLAYAVDVGPTGVFVAGATSGDLQGTNRGTIDAFVRRYGTNGSLGWTRQFGTTAPDDGNAVAVTSDRVHVMGDTYGTLPRVSSSGEFDGFVRSFSLRGNLARTRQFGTPGNDFVLGGDADDLRLVVVGTTDGAFKGRTSAGGYDAFVLRRE